MGVAPLQPTPAPLPIEGLWECRETAALGGGSGFSSCVHHNTWGRGGREGGGGRATVASAERPPGACTPGLGRVEHDLHLAALPPRLYECADREPRPSVGVVPCGGVAVLRGWLGRPRGGRHCVPHGVHPRDGGQHRAGGREQVPGRGEGPVAPEEAPDGAAVGDTRPMAPGALCLVVPPLDQEHPALGSASPGLRGGGSGVADGEGTQVPKGRQQGGRPRRAARPPSNGGGGTARAGPPRHTASLGPRGARGPTLPGPGERAAGPSAPI